MKNDGFCLLPTKNKKVCLNHGKLVRTQGYIHNRKWLDHWLLNFRDERSTFLSSSVAYAENFHGGVWFRVI